MQALVVEDNRSLGRLVEGVLGDAGMGVVLVGTGEAAQRHALSNGFDVIILDVMLPDANGVDVCRALRAQNVCTPILMLSILKETTDRVRGLEGGADDYLAKPFDPTELLARVRALLRRGSLGAAAALRVGDVEMNLLTRTLRRADRTIALTAREFSLLEYFMRHPDRVLTRVEIGAHVWDMNFDPDSNVIEVFVSALRRKLGEPALIHTRIGAGYVLSSSPPETPPRAPDWRGDAP